MKRYLTLLLLLFCTLGAVESHNLPPVLNERLHIMDIYDEPESAHLGQFIKFVFDREAIYHTMTYTFTIHNRPTLIMANAMNSERVPSTMALNYRPFNSTGAFREITGATNSFKLPELLRNKHKFGFEFEEDLTQVPARCPVLYYEALQPGEYELVCETRNEPDIPDGNLRTNIYLSPMGVNEETAIEIGNFTGDFSKKIVPGTFNCSDVYYKFQLDSINVINITHQGPFKEKPIIELRNSHSVMASSDQYALTADSIPQIKDCVGCVGTNYIHVRYPVAADAKVGLNITGKVDYSGISWEHPFDMGSYSDSLSYENSYNPSAFVPSDSYETPCVYHRFNIRSTMDLSILSTDGVSSITLYDASHRILHQTKKEEYLTSLDVSNLPAGTYFFTAEGGNKGRNTYVKVKGRKPVQQLSDTKNYVTTMKASINTPCALDLQNPLNASQEIRYFDSFGRIEQTIRYGVTPTLKNLVSGIEYDRMYRDSCSWLPAACAGTGGYVSRADFKKCVLELYNDAYAYEKSIYDGSPLNRLTEKFNPGKSWHTTGHSEKIEYQTNSPASRCRIFEVTGAKENPVLVQKGLYAANELNVVVEKDEEGLPKYSYSNKLGQTILTRTINTKDTMDTYQVYDDFGNLAFVLPPMAVDGLQTLGQEKALDLYAYQYRYGKWNHYSGKKLPGAMWTEFRYDEKGRLCQVRDEEMKKRNEWKCFLYDQFGREVMVGIYKGNSPGLVSAYIDFVPNNPNTCYGYLLNDNFKNDLRIEKVTYYDSYQYKSVNTNFTPEMNYMDAEDYGHRYSDDKDLIKCKGLVTGTMTRVVGTNQMLCSSTYYDYYQRPVQSRGKDVNGKTHIRKFKYDFAGNTLSSREEVSGVSLTGSMTYDHAGRLLKNTHLVNNSLSATLSYNYDELGRLKNVSRSNGSTPLSTTYQYNPRNWLTSIESPLFSQKLYYTDGTGVKSYNGNISSMTWKAGNERITRGYRFEYDSLSRMKNAAYGEGEALSLIPGKLDERITSYDKNGNILRLKRYGQTSASGYSLMDDLTATLKGNQLVSVDDAATGSAYDNGFEFKNGSRQSTEYSYDANGNLTKDLNKKIADIQYNYLNLPDRITFEDGGAVSYLYDAAGTKLRVVRTAAGNTTTTDYCGNVIFENGTPKTVLTEAGFVSLNDNKYHYYLQDHQGNNRVVTDQNGNVEEVNHYYPFGGVFASSGNIQPYKYNGKELDMANGLNWYDYGARHYDAALGRWNAVDALSEKYYGVSPYAYCNNDPIKNIDLDGRDWYLYGTTGQLYYNKDKNQSQITYQDQSFTRVGGNDMLGNMKGVTEKLYGFKESATLANTNGYNINPTQQIMSEVSREQSYKTGPNNVTITTGNIDVVNEEYGIFSASKDKVVGVKTEHLFEEPLGVLGAANILLTGGKQTDYVERNHIIYEKPKTEDKVRNAVGAVYGVMSTITTGKHDYRSVKIYNNWVDYSKATRGVGRMLDYKK